MYNISNKIMLFYKQNILSIKVITIVAIYNIHILYTIENKNKLTFLL